MAVNWRDLVELLERQVPSGRVTTYAEVSSWGYGTPERNQPVRSLLVGARNHGFQELTNRVVRVNGELSDLPAGPGQQRAQLESEGVALTEDGRVDLDRNPPVQLTDN